MIKGERKYPRNIELFHINAKRRIINKQMGRDLYRSTCMSLFSCFFVRRDIPVPILSLICVWHSIPSPIHIIDDLSSSPIIN